MTPYYSRSSMGMLLEERERFHAQYESMTVAKLEQLGFEVVSPEAFSQSLVEHDAWQIYEDGWRFRHALEDYFRGSDGPTSVAIEVLTLRALAKKGVLASDVVLFGEVVYQSQTTCIVLADEQVSFAVVDRVQGVELKKGADGNPCVVSHLQSMLVDAASEQVMWVNQALVELHLEAHSEQSVALTIERVIDLVFAGDEGLLALSKR